MMSENIAEEQAAQHGIKLVTGEELLKESGYDTHTFTTSNGHGYKVESLVPGNLLIDLGSPVVRQFTDGLEEGEESVRTPMSDQNIYEYIKQLLCDHVINVNFAMIPQHRCGKNVYSIDRVERDEILEIYRELREFSLRDVDTFQETTPETSE